MNMAPLETQEAQTVLFVGNRRVAHGDLPHIARVAKQHHDSGSTERIAVFDELTGRPVDLDLSGTEAEVVARVLHPPSEPPARRRGRPRLGVISREVSLLPRHWNWLAEQPGGASAALRRLVDAARKQPNSEQARRQALEVAHRFLWDIAGNQPGFEEATRLLFAGDFEGLDEHVADWPDGIVEQLRRFVSKARDSEHAPERTADRQ